MIKLTDLLEAEKAFTATSKETGNVAVFKTKAARDAAVKAGSHEKRKDDKDDAVDVPTGEKKPNMFSKDAGYDAPDADKSEPKSSTPKLDKDGDGGMSSDTARSVEDYLNKELGLDGSADLNSGGAIEYNISGSTNTLQIGNDEIDGKPFSVGLANEDGFDPDDTYKSFDNSADAMAYAKELAQKLKSEKKTSEPKQNEPVKDSSGGRAGNPKINKAVSSKAKELGITPQKLGKEEYESRMSKAAVEALTDSNFHSEARKLISILEDKPEWDSNPMNDPDKPKDVFSKEYDEWRKNTVFSSELYDSAEGTDEIAHLATNQSGWEGETSIDAIAYDLKMNGSKKLAAKIQSIFEGKVSNGFKNHSLKDFLK